MQSSIEKIRKTVEELIYDSHFSHLRVVSGSEERQVRLDVAESLVKMFKDDIEAYEELSNERYEYDASEEVEEDVE